MSELDIILIKLKKVGNPVFLLKMVRDVNKFIKQHQIDYPKATDFDIIHFQIIKQVFEVSPMGIQPLLTIPNQANVIRVSREALKDVYDFVASEQGASDDLERLTTVLNQLRKLRNIKQYKTILKLVDVSFETNLKMGDIIKSGINKAN